MYLTCFIHDFTVFDIYLPNYGSGIELFKWFGNITEFETNEKIIKTYKGMGYSSYKIIM